MAALRPCIEWTLDEQTRRRTMCGVLSERARCPEHTRRYEKRRLEKEPWRHFYDDPRWSRARMKAMRNDGFRCTFAISGRRCNTTVPLDVHHETKLRHLWERHGSPQRGAPGWNAFILAGCDARSLRTLCLEHHKFVDNNDPAEKWVGTPGERATSQHRRSFRSSKRTHLKKRSQASRTLKRPSRGELRETGEDD